MSDVIELSLPSRLNLIYPAGELLKGLLSTTELTAEEIEDVWLAFHEILVNAIQHGNREDPTKRTTIWFRIDQDEVEIEVADQGEGFDPALLPEPTRVESLTANTGRGLAIARHFMDSIEIDSRPGSPTTVRMLRRRRGD